MWERGPRPARPRPRGAFWRERSLKLAAYVQTGMTVKEALTALRSPNLKWG